MNMHDFLVVLGGLVLGVMLYIGVRRWVAWDAKQQPIFWVCSFGPILLVSWINPTNTYLTNAVYAVCGGLIFSESLRPKLSAFWGRFQQKMQGDAQVYRAPKSQKKSSAQKKPPRK